VALLSALMVMPKSHIAFLAFLAASALRTNLHMVSSVLVVNLCVESALTHWQGPSQAKIYHCLGEVMAVSSVQQ